MKNEEIKITEGQLIATAMYMIILITSIFILYNQYLIQQGKEKILSEDTVRTINILNRIVVFLLVTYFLYTSYKNIEIAKRKGDELKYLNLQFIAALITVVSSLIVLYVSFDQFQKSFIPISTTENPTL